MSLSSVIKRHPSLKMSLKNIDDQLDFIFITNRPWNCHRYVGSPGEAWKTRAGGWLSCVFSGTILALQTDVELYLMRNIVMKIYGPLARSFKAIDARLDRGISFFFKHYGKTKFMVSMSKKAQSLGLEKLYEKGPKAFLYFFLFYLVRDTILYILIPIYFAYSTS